MQEEEEGGERIQVTAGALQLDLRDAGRIQSHKNELDPGTEFPETFWGQEKRLQQGRPKTCTMGILSHKN